MTDIVKRDFTTSIDAMLKASTFFAKGGMFIHPTSKQPLNEAEIFSIVEYGRELGVDPVIALQNIVPVKGRLCTSAALMLGLAVNAGVKYEVLREEDGGCEIKFMRDGYPPYISSFTLEDAKQAGLLHKDNWTNYPRAMYKARAIANGCRFMVPDKLAGIYTTEEITDVNIDLAHPIPVDKPKQNGTEDMATEKQTSKIWTMMNKIGIDLFSDQFKDFLLQRGMLPDSKSFASMTKVEASGLIQALDEQDKQIVISFYADKTYHEEMKELFTQFTKNRRINVLINMAPLIEDLKTLPKKITEELTDQQTYDYFSLFLMAIYNEEDNRKNGPDLIKTATDLFDATPVVPSKPSPPIQQEYSDDLNDDDFGSLTFEEV